MRDGPARREDAPAHEASPREGVQLEAISSRTTSPGCACRFSFDFSNTGTPSFITSNRPPELGTSATSVSGKCCVISAAKLVARDS